MDDDNSYDWLAGDALPVPFSGGGTRTGPLTVGQANMRRCVLRDDPAHLNACLVLQLPDGTGLDAITTTLLALVLRHESLRTTYPVDPELRQVVADAGEFTVHVHEADGEPEGFARTVGVAMRAVRFDPEAELPLRATVVTVDGRPRHLVLVLCHIAVDAAGLDLLTAEWHTALAGGALGPRSAVQPVDLALTEHSPTGGRRLTSSLRYWENLLRGTPQSMFAVPEVGPCDWMLPRLRVRSAAAATALTGIAERTGASRPTIVLAAMSALLGRRLDQRTFVVATPAANRFLPELTDYVGTVAQDGLVSIPLEGATSFDALVGRARNRALAALRHSWFDYEDLLPVIERVERERGSHWARDCVFNDLTSLTLEGLLTSPPVPAAAVEDPADPTISPAADPTTGPTDDPRLDWFVPESMLTRLMLWAVRLEDEVELELWADPNLLPAREAEEFGRGIVRLLLAAADKDVDLDRLGEFAALTPVIRGDGWYEIDHSWVQLASVQAMVDEIADGPSLVTAVPDERLGHRLECHLAAAPASADPSPSAACPPTPHPADLHTACLAALRHRRLGAMAPHHYTVVDRAPADPTDPAAWRARPILAEGTGRAHPAPPPNSPPAAQKPAASTRNSTSTQPNPPSTTPNSPPPSPNPAPVTGTSPAAALNSPAGVPS